MSYESIIKSAGTRCDIKYYAKSTTAGSQITKTWKIRHNNVPCRVNTAKAASKSEMLYYDAAKVFADFIMYIPYRAGITNHDRVYIGSRIFNIKKIDNWDFQNLYLRIAMKEETDT